MKTGPQATFGYDLALTQILEDARHFFVIEAGTEKGAEILRELPRTAARDDEQRKAEAVVANIAAQMGRAMDTDGIKEVLYRSYEHSRWDEVASCRLT